MTGNIRIAFLYPNSNPIDGNTEIVFWNHNIPHNYWGKLSYKAHLEIKTMVPIP